MQYQNLVNMRNMGAYAGNLARLLINNITSTLPARGVSSPVYARASSAYVPDNLGAIVTVPAGVASFPGMRLSYNLAEGATLGPEVITVAANRDFSSDTGYWLKGTNTTISAGILNFNTESNGQGVGHAGDLVIGSYYQVTFTITNISSGSVRVQAGNTLGTARTTSGTYTEILLCTGVGNPRIYATVNGTIASVDNISYFTIIPDWLSTALAGITPITTGKGLLSEPAGSSLFSNSLAPATQTISLTTANAGAWTTTVTGAGTVTITAGTGTATGLGAVTAGAPRTITVTGAGTFVFTISGGTPTCVNVENNTVGTSAMIGSGATQTRAATVDAYATAGNLIAGATNHIKLTFTPLNLTAGLVQNLFGCRTDASNLLEIIATGSTSLIFRKRVAGVNYECALTVAMVVGTQYTVDAIINADNTTSLAMTGYDVVTNANTAACPIAATFEIGSNGAGAQQAHGYFGKCGINGR